MYKTNILLVLVFFLSGTGLYAQQSNIDILKNKTFSEPKFESKRVVRFGLSTDSGFIKQYNPVTLTLSSLLYTYQKWLSPQISADCLYAPTCSEYTKQLFKQYGLLGGFITSADRLMRCDRISATTISHVCIDEHDGKVHENVSRYILRKKK